MSELPKKLTIPFELELEKVRYGSWSLRRVFIYLLRPRWHSKSFRTASRFPMPTTPEQPDFVHSKFLVFCSLQPTKSVCSAAAEKCLSGVGQPLSSVSGRQRYNTLDFASKIVCQQGCFSPLLETQSQGIASLWTLAIFCAWRYPNCKNAVWHRCSENTKPLYSPSLRGWKIQRFLFFLNRPILETVLSRNIVAFYWFSILSR